MKLQNLIHILILIACIGLLPKAQAVGPDTDGNIPGSNNGEGIGVLVSRTAGVWNTGTGFEALSQLTAGNQNTATGLRALFNDTNGGFNTATGVFSLFSNTSGFFNSATGAYSLANNISGTHNTANGYAALYRNTADNNTATGFATLYHNTTGNNNTATGSQALQSNTTGGGNTANGSRALASNTTGLQNTANGFQALSSNTTGSGNTAIGSNALVSNTAATNTAIGSGALFGNTTGNNNTALGINAGLNQNTGSNNIYIGDLGGGGESNVIAIGAFPSSGIGYTATLIGGIYSNVQPVVGTDPDYVTINSVGRLGRGNVSSRRYKHDIRPMGKTSEALFALNPVTFRYKKEIDPSQTLAFGLIAEEVEKVYPDLVGRNAEGQPESVRYEQINAMLLNEFLKEHKKVEEQHATITELKSTVAQQQKGMEILTAQLKEQAAQIQKVTVTIGRAASCSKL